MCPDNPWDLEGEVWPEEPALSPPSAGCQGEGTKGTGAGSRHGQEQLLGSRVIPECPESPAPRSSSSLSNRSKSGAQLLSKCLNSDLAGGEEQLSCKSSGKCVTLEGYEVLLHNYCNNCSHSDLL